MSSPVINLLWMSSYVTEAGRSSWDTGCNWGLWGEIRALGPGTRRFCDCEATTDSISWWLTDILEQNFARDWGKEKQEHGRKHLGDWEGRNELSAPRSEEDFVIGHRSVVSFPPGSQRPGLRGSGFLISFVLTLPSKLALWENRICI